MKPRKRKGNKIVPENKTDEIIFFEGVKDIEEPEWGLKEWLLAWYEYWKAWVGWMVDQGSIDFSITFDDIAVLCTLFVLVGDDIRLIAFEKGIDPIWEVLNSIAFFFFSLEFILISWAKSTVKINKEAKKIRDIITFEGYIFSFFFWLDLLSTLSVIPDIPWMAESLGIDSLSTANTNTAGSASRSGSKAARVLRMVRLVRLVRIYRIALNKRKQLRKKLDKKELNDMGMENFQDILELQLVDDTPPSKVGEELSDIITKRVIMGVLLMLCVVPLLIWNPTNYVRERSTKYLHEFNINNDTTQLDIAVDEYIDSLQYNLASELIYLEILPTYNSNSRGILMNDIKKLNKLRHTEVSRTIIQTNEFITIAQFNLRNVSIEAASFGLCMTVFIAIMLISGSLMFNNLAERIVLKPIERMMWVVKVVAAYPLTEIHFHDRDGMGAYELRQLESAIEKITAMLRVGFGEAGAEIISSNLQLESDSGAMINPMIPGTKVYAIFSFCYLHHFDHLTINLEGEIMTYVNNIASVVHTTVGEWGGQTNKNLGNAFLLVWLIADIAGLNQMMESNVSMMRRTKSIVESKDLANFLKDTETPKKEKTRKDSFFKLKRNSILNKEETDSVKSKVEEEEKQDFELFRIPGVEEFADKALIAVIKIIIETNKRISIQSFKTDERLFLKDTDEEFTLKLSFGLDAGWGIQGAVGSLAKVDATYLSPHVNLSARMTTAAKQYGVNILMSENYHKILSKIAQFKCRALDRVTVKGSKAEMNIYTYDVYEKQNFFREWEDEENVIYRYYPNIWSHDEDLIQIKSIYTKEFYTMFNNGFHSYINSDWLSAKEYFEKSDEMMKEYGGDLPSQNILNYISSYNYIVPPEWKGYRALVNK